MLADSEAILVDADSEALVDADLRGTCWRDSDALLRHQMLMCLLTSEALVDAGFVTALVLSADSSMYLLTLDALVDADSEADVLADSLDALVDADSEALVDAATQMLMCLLDSEALVDADSDADVLADS